MDKVSSSNIMATLNAFQKDVTSIYRKHQRNMTSAYYV